MTAFLDSNVIVAGLVPQHEHHAVCYPWVNRENIVADLHAKLETYNTMTGRYRIPPAAAASLLEGIEGMQWVELHPADYSEALGSGAQGAAVYDALHCAVALRIHAGQVVSINVKHLQRFTRLPLVNPADRMDAPDGY